MQACLIVLDIMIASAMLNRVPTLHFLETGTVPHDDVIPCTWPLSTRFNGHNMCRQTLQNDLLTCCTFSLSAMTFKESCANPFHLLQCRCGGAEHVYW